MQQSLNGQGREEDVLPLSHSARKASPKKKSTDKTMADAKPYVKPAATEGSAQINLKVRDTDTNTIQFKIKRSTPLSKLMNAYSSRLFAKFLPRPPTPPSSIPHLTSFSGEVRSLPFSRGGTHLLY